MIVMRSGGESSAGASRLHNPRILIFNTPPPLTLNVSPTKGFSWEKFSTRGGGVVFNSNVRGSPNPNPKPLTLKLVAAVWGDH